MGTVNSGAGGRQQASLSMCSWWWEDLVSDSSLPFPNCVVWVNFLIGRSSSVGIWTSLVVQ